MNLLLIQDYLKKNKLSWLLVPREDEFLGEYVPACNERLLWATGFSGSAGLAVIGQNEAYLFVDGRYTLQAKKQAKGFKIYSLSDFFDWLENEMHLEDNVALNLKLHSQGFVKKIHETYSKIQHIDPYPVDELWKNRPKAPQSILVLHPLKYSGESHASKVKRVIDAFSEDADALYVQDPHDLAWVLNLRGGDLEFTPISLGRGLIWKNGSVDVFFNTIEISEEVRTHLGSNVHIHAFGELENYLLKPLTVQIDPAASAYDRELIGGRVVIKPSPIQFMKAIKNSIEIEGMRKAHKWDGQALRKFRQWLQTQEVESLDEIIAAEKLELFRRECPEYKGPSFPTISGFAENGAIVHYRAESDTKRKFKQNALYLVDSGGQYLEGTTDVTRTFVIGQPTSEQKKAYTLVLKGHLRLARAIFPKGTTGHQLDALARYDLWQHGLNYEHGTGHGVGSYLSVHEGPQGISPRINPTPLQPGMVLSNEPGYYNAGEYGIRIENMMVVKESQHDGYLCFETLTRVPYEEDLIDDTMLTDEERFFIGQYK